MPPFWKERLLFFRNRISHDPELFDLRFHDIPGVHKGRRLAILGQTAGRAGCHHIAGFQRKNLRAEGHELGNRVHQLLRVRFLQNLAVHLQLHRKIVRIGQFIGR